MDEFFEVNGKQYLVFFYQEPEVQHNESKSLLLYLHDRHVYNVFQLIHIAVVTRRIPREPIQVVSSLQNQKY